MSFQPLGFRFEVNSLLEPVQVKQSLRNAKKEWFAVRDGPRGWIVGSYMCFWNSALNRYGPMVFARIYSDSFGAKIVGRAGSDLNGTLFSLLLMPFMGWLIFKMWEEGQETPKAFLFIILIFGLGLPLILWLGHKGRGEANSLVQFISRTVGPSMSRSTRGLRTPPRHTAMLIVNGEPLARPATEEDIMTAIPELGVDEFVVVERAEQEYLQVLSRTDDWLIEEREGGDDKHFQAIMAKGAPGDLENYAAAERRVIRVVADYLCGGSRDQTLSWKQIYK